MPDPAPPPSIFEVRTKRRVTCTHCGDVTEQSFLLEWFTCGACDKAFRGARTSAPLSDGPCSSQPTPLAPKHDEGASTVMSDKPQKVRCIECNGTGYAEQPVRAFTFGNDCPVCRGEGWLSIPSENSH